MFLYFNLAFRFLLELCVVAAAGYWGYQLGTNPLTRLIFASSLPILVMIIWGLFGSPAAPYRLDGIYVFLLEFTIFSLGTLALYATGHTTFAVILAISWTLNKSLLTVLDG